METVICTVTLQSAGNHSVGYGTLCINSTAAGKRHVLLHDTILRPFTLTVSPVDLKRGALQGIV